MKRMLWDFLLCDNSLEMQCVTVEENVFRDLEALVSV